MKTQPDIAYPILIKLLTRKGFQVGLILVTLWLTLYYDVAYYVYTSLAGVHGAGLQTHAENSCNNTLE